MEFEKLLAERWSARKFSQTPVPEDKINKILEMTRFAPTAANRQPQRIIVLRTSEEMSLLAECTHYSFNAPSAFIVCYDRNEAWSLIYSETSGGVVDAAIIGAYVMLAIQDQGLGTTWVGHFDHYALGKRFNLPETCVPVALFPFGYISSDARPSPKHASRKPLADIVHFGGFAKK